MEIFVGQDGILPPIENRPVEAWIVFPIPRHPDFQPAAGYQPALQAI
jgi:hypothetical protein